MNNYVSIGVDALVTLNFHNRRQSWPWFFANRIVNKVGVTDALSGLLSYSQNFLMHSTLIVFIVTCFFTNET